MAHIVYQDSQFESLPDESVLDTLLRNNIHIPNSCRAGLCHACLMRCVKGDVSAEAQKDLKPAQKEQNYFLACQCKTKQDLEVVLPDNEDIFISALLVDKQQLSPSVWQFRLETAVPVFYHAGQFINLKKDADCIRSYSLSSLPSKDDFLEIQVHILPDGEMSQWLFNNFNIGQHIDIEGPNGHCYYTNTPDSPLLLLGTGTGLAPVYGIARDALHQGHQGEIHLYHGAASADELYLHKQLNALATEHHNFHYYGCVHESDIEGIYPEHAPDLAMANHKSLKDWKVFLCGAPEMVQKYSKLAFLGGANMKDINSDPFTPAQK